LISEVYIEMNQKGPIYWKTLGYYVVTTMQSLCMLASSLASVHSKIINSA